MMDPVRYLHTSCECGTRHDFEQERAETVTLPCGRQWTPVPLKKGTSYVCPAGGLNKGHSSLYTGGLRIVSPRDGICSCGERLVEEVEDGVHVVSWEMIGPFDDDWKPISKQHPNSQRAAEHAAGLRSLIAQGELIRNVSVQAFDLVARAES